MSAQDVQSIQYGKKRKKRPKPKVTDKQLVNEKLRPLRGIVDWSMLNDIYNSPNQTEILDVINGPYSKVFDMFYRYLDDVSSATLPEDKGVLLPYMFDKIDTGFENFFYYLERLSLL